MRFVNRELESGLKRANKNIFRSKEAQSVLNKSPQATTDLLSELCKKRRHFKVKTRAIFDYSSGSG